MDGENANSNQSTTTLTHHKIDNIAGKQFPDRALVILAELLKHPEIRINDIFQPFGFTPVGMGAIWGAQDKSLKAIMQSRRCAPNVYSNFSLIWTYVY